MLVSFLTLSIKLLSLTFSAVTLRGLFIESDMG